MKVPEFQINIWDCWRKTDWGEESIRKIKTEQFYSTPEKWNRYITKSTTENSEIDSIDWENYHWNQK